jgi:hypothetical protein
MDASAIFNTITRIKHWSGSGKILINLEKSLTRISERPYAYTDFKSELITSALDAHETFFSLRRPDRCMQNIQPQPGRNHNTIVSSFTGGSKESLKSGAFLVTRLEVYLIRQEPLSGEWILTSTREAAGAHKSC